MTNDVLNAIVESGGSVVTERVAMAKELLAARAEVAHLRAKLAAEKERADAHAHDAAERAAERDDALRRVMEASRVAATQEQAAGILDGLRIEAIEDRDAMRAERDEYAGRNARSAAALIEATASADAACDDRDGYRAMADDLRRERDGVREDLEAALRVVELIARYR